MGTLHIIHSNDASLQGLSIPLAASTYRIGRDPASDLVLADTSVSLRHAVITATSDGHAIADEGSGNGVWVNGARVTQRPLANGDTIVVGETTLRFEQAIGAQKTVALAVPTPAPPPPPPQPAAVSPAASAPATGASGCAIGCLITSIVLFFLTIAGSLFALYRAGYLPGL